MCMPCAINIYRRSFGFRCYIPLPYNLTINIIPFSLSLSLSLNISLTVSMCLCVLVRVFHPPHPNFHPHHWSEWVRLHCLCSSIMLTTLFLCIQPLNPPNRTHPVILIRIVCVFPNASRSGCERLQGLAHHPRLRLISRSTTN